ncbi:phenylalanine--tRNA ligase subunit beta [Candidatus Pacearchaeota archaeon]|nr:phenylalanine--tRNA ligase subunit beta [Candidatus Pacearchaeota archaeon]
MANIKFPKKLFEKEIGKLDEKMKKKISMFGTPLESVEEGEIEVEIFPDRPDLLSYQGFKRAFLAFLGKKTGLKKYRLHKPGKNYYVKVDSSVKKVRPYTVCAIIKGLKLNDEKIKEIIELQEKLHNTVGRKRKKLAIGIYPLEKIKLPITYKALEPDKIKFTPLEMNREMSGLQILQRHSTGREYAHLLSGKRKFPVFLDAEKNVLSMPPIINSQLTGKVDENTKDVFIECSGFNIDVLKKSLNIIVTALADMSPSIKIYQMKVKYKKPIVTPDLTPDKRKISKENTNKLLGLNLSKKQIQKMLEKMGYELKKNNVKIPAWRTDILHEVDLIEDIAIAYGYENFEPEIPKISTLGKENPRETIKRKIAHIFAGLKMTEVSNYHLTTPRDQFSKMGLNPKKQKNSIEVKESKTEYNILRKDLTHCLLKNLSENVDVEYPQKIFEVGKIFNSNLMESEKLAAVISPGDFTEIKQVLKYLSKMLNQEIYLEEAKDFPSWFINGRVARIKLDKETLGFIGEIHPKILNNWKLKMPAALFEIDLEEIFKKLE